jgi:hypothetical protein
MTRRAADETWATSPARGRLCPRASSTVFHGSAGRLLFLVRDDYHVHGALAVAACTAIAHAEVHAVLQFECHMFDAVRQVRAAAKPLDEAAWLAEATFVLDEAGQPASQSDARQSRGMRCSDPHRTARCRA